MNGDIRLVGKQRALQLLQKKPLAAYFRQRPIEYFVAASAQRHQRHVQFGVMIPQLLGHMFSLPDGQRGFSWCNSEFVHIRLLSWAGGASSSSRMRARFLRLTGG